MDDRLELLQAYRRLGLDPGADLAAVEARYRERVMALHPDRHAGGANTIDAGATLTALSAARRLLRDHRRRFGRLPTAAELQPSPPRPQAPPPARGRSPARSPRRHHTLLAAAAAGFAIWAVIEFSRPVPAPTAADAAAHPHAEEPPPAQRARIRLGSSEDEVLAILGRPAYAHDDTWEYGPSRIEFAAGRVSGWYSSPLAPLPVDEHRPLGVRDPLDAH
ncbi:hypothetical protein MBSD_n1665 [Mizugakiibacter sediminis]|uniref:J domain-containing protein n=1 Tax=Mizugakiibacter sediminis TaxID=1475481 RepID=A0A0K8QNB2_9GAMM|nr:J domain-containing protein [Mizugakiibacter sediminis]GAP66358.1 hypothetical protein MBSD_n1665 [Mizugakiibacter sediminis]